MYSGIRIKDLDKLLVDTSAWIEFFRKKEPYYSIVLEYMDNDAVCCTGIIFAELLQGAKSEKEINTIKEFVYVFDFISENIKFWEKAGELSYALHRKGKTVGLADCYVAVAANSMNLKLLTLDKHFKVIEKEIELNLF